MAFQKGKSLSHASTFKYEKKSSFVSSMRIRFFYFFWNEFLTRSFQLKSIEKAMVNLIDTLRSAPQEEGVLTQLLRLQRQKENILFGFAKTSPNAVPAGKEQLQDQKIWFHYLFLNVCLLVLFPK